MRNGECNGERVRDKNVAETLDRPSERRKESERRRKKERVIAMVYYLYARPRIIKNTSRRDAIYIR